MPLLEVFEVRDVSVRSKKYGLGRRLSTAADVGSGSCSSTLYFRVKARQQWSARDGEDGAAGAAAGEVGVEVEVAVRVPTILTVMRYC